jgi:hypothetical protein
MARSSASSALASGVFAFLAGLAITAFSLYRHGFPDFEVFWTAARHAHDPLLYDSAHLTAAQRWMPGDGPRPFIYPPTFLLLIFPFGLLPFLPAYYLWVGASCAAIVLAARLMVRPAWAAAILPLCIPVSLAAGYGQSVLFAGAGLIAGAALIERRPAVAGALIAAAACMKPQLMLLSPLLIVGRSRAIVGAGAAGGGLVLASLVFGPERWVQWIAALPQFERIVRQMPLHFINPLSPGLGLAQKLVIAASGVGFALWTLGRSLPERIAGVAAGSLCCSLYAVRPDLAIFAPTALAWVLGGRAASDWLRRLAGVAMLSGLVANPLGLAVFMLAAAAAGVAPKGWHGQRVASYP